MSMNFNIVQCLFKEIPSHTGAVVASVVLLVVLALSVVVYSKCQLNFKLWYKNVYGEYEFNG